MPDKISVQVGAKPIQIESGKLAKQADGAVTVQLGESIVIVAAVAATSAKPGQDFFPLTVDYREKAAAAGRFPGGYFKREGRPTEKELLMFEGSAKEISDSDFTSALQFGHDCCRPVIAAQKELAARSGKSKRSIVTNVVPDEILSEAKALAGGRMVPALLIPGKLAREAAVKTVTDEVGARLVEKFGAEKVTEFVLQDAFYYLQKEAVRGLGLNDQKRMDGRGFDDIRALVCEVGLLPRAHGSALFSRGETQALVLATLGTSEGAQEFDS